MKDDNNKDVMPETALGKKTEYDSHYNPDRLFAIPRISKREEIDVPDRLPFAGYDTWNHYEVSWLNSKGKPLVALAVMTYACDTPNMIESKSMKLYFNSLNNTRFDSAQQVKETIASDISAKVKGDVEVSLQVLPVKQVSLSCDLEGFNIDDLDIECDTYHVCPRFLTVESQTVSEVLTSNLLKSNCLVTHQPDWGSVQIRYQGNKIDREGLLKYIVSFRNHDEFHEQCIERIFMDIMRYCQPEMLTVYGRYTRRGGVDINPVRSTHKQCLPVSNSRLVRQ